MSVFSNVIKPQGLEPLQFPTKFRSHSEAKKDNNNRNQLVITNAFADCDAAVLHIRATNFGNHPPHVTLALTVLPGASAPIDIPGTDQQEVLVPLPDDFCANPS